MMSLEARDRYRTSFIIGGIAIAAGLLSLLTLGAYRVAGSSMEPTLHNGEYIVIEKVSYTLRRPQRGDVLVFSDHQDPSNDYIKRLIGLPGDTIEVVDDCLFVNHHAMIEPYLKTLTLASFPARTLGHDEYFTLGDNRSHSRDSRSFGSITRKDIIGRAWIVYQPPLRLGLAPHYIF